MFPTGYARLMRTPSILAYAVTAALLFSLSGCITAGSDDDDSSSAGDEATQYESQSGTLSTLNAAGRSGSYYLPARRSDQPIPLLLHATGGNGAGFLSAFSAEAIERGFAIIAPDSRVSPAGDFTWEVGTEPGEITPDYSHSLAVIAEVQEQHDLLIDEQSVLAAGFSGGASSAPYLATNEELFTAFASLHGGVFPGGLGDHIVPGWFSTGEDDTIRSPEHVQGHLDSLIPLGFDELELHIFPGGHTLSDEEIEGLVTWWLADD